MLDCQLVNGTSTNNYFWFKPKTDLSMAYFKNFRYLMDGKWFDSVMK